MKRLLIISVLLSFLAVSAVGQEYVAKIADTDAWMINPNFSMPINNMVAFISKEYPETGVIVYAVQNGHYPFEEGTVFYNFIKSSNAKLKIDEEILSLIVGQTMYLKVRYIRYIAHVDKKPGNIRVWQFSDGNVEYTIISVCPNSVNTAVERFIADNLKLLPPPKTSEEEFISAVKKSNELCLQTKGIPLDDGVWIINVEASPESKQFKRTYKIDYSVPSEYQEFLLSKAGNQAIVDEERNTALLVQQAIELGYSLVNIWQDENGEFLISHELDLVNR